MKSSSIGRGKGFYVFSNMICFETNQSYAYCVPALPKWNRRRFTLFGRFTGVRDLGFGIRDSKSIFEKRQ